MAEDLEALPRGPELYRSGEIVAYRTKPGKDHQARERWELQPHLQTDPLFVRRFRDMGELPRRLPLRCFGRVEVVSATQIVMLAPPWVPLRAMIAAVHRGEVIDPTFVLTLIRDVASDLAAARETVFRTLTPTAFAISVTGAPRLLDLMHVTRGRTAATGERGILRGELAYMAPEQERGLPFDGKADVFVLGLLAIELLTGTRVFRGAVINIQRQLDSNILVLPPLSSLLTRLIRNMTASQRADRMTAAEVVAEIHGDVWSPEEQFQGVRRLAPAEVASAIEQGY